MAYCGHLAQLKVNLPGPLWSPAAGVLAQMAQRFGDEIWRIIFEELQTLYSSSPPTDNVWLEQMDKDEEQGGEDKDPWEEERTWRDPSAHKLRGIVGKWLNTQHRTGELVEVGQFDRIQRFIYLYSILVAKPM
jgi:U3 small nucleolar RNA-associated protein 20